VKEEQQCREPLCHLKIPVKNMIRMQVIHSQKQLGEPLAKLLQ
jgi:hypothetical protein